jgi:hypothetical protein
MKKTEAIRMAEIARDTELARAVLTNPVVSLVTGTVVLGLLKSYTRSNRSNLQSILDVFAGEGLKDLITTGGLVAICTAQALGPSGTQSLINLGSAGLSKALPLLLAAGG